MGAERDAGFEQQQPAALPRNRRQHRSRVIGVVEQAVAMDDVELLVDLAFEGEGIRAQDAAARRCLVAFPPPLGHHRRQQRAILRARFDASDRATVVEKERGVVADARAEFQDRAISDGQTERSQMFQSARVMAQIRNAVKILERRFHGGGIGARTGREFGLRILAMFLRPPTRGHECSATVFVSWIIPPERERTQGTIPPQVGPLRRPSAERKRNGRSMT